MAASGRLEQASSDPELCCGLPVGARFVGTPRVGLTTSPYGRDYRVGNGLGVLEHGT